MDQKQVLIGVVAVLSVSAAAFALLQPDGEDSSSRVEPVEGDFNVTEDGTRYTVHPSELLMGCSGMDCIPSIDDPRYTSVEEADKWMNDRDKVLAVELNGERKAYPLRILNLHEIVNDRIGGKPVAVTYCPLCRSGLAFSREVEGRTLEFGVSGRLYNANLVMYDRQTETYWSQVQGEAIVGPLVPTRLEIVTSEISDWGNYSEAHPDARVLSRDTGRYPRSAYGRNPYGGYESRESVGFGVSEVDERLPSKEIVYGVSIGGESKAYTEDDIKTENLIQDSVGGEPVLLVEDQEDGGIAVFLREVDGQELNFSVENSGMIDSRGVKWSFDGESENGEQLGRLNSHGFFWFAWSKFHPGTKIY